MFICWLVKFVYGKKIIRFVRNYNADDHSFTFFWCFFHTVVPFVFFFSDFLFSLPFCMTPIY